MMLPRKRQRPNQAGPALSSASADTTLEATSQAATASVPSFDQMSMNDQISPAKSEITARQPRQLHKARSWYSSWPRPPKATASTSVAKENIFGGTVKSSRASDLSKYKTRRPSDTASIGSGKTINTLTNVPETSTMPDSDNKTPGPKQLDEVNGVTEPGSELLSPKEDDAGLGRPVTPERPATSSGWTSWLLRTPFTETTATPQATTPQPSRALQTSDAEEQPKTPVTEPAAAEPLTENTKPEELPSTSWFGFWATTPATKETLRPETMGDTNTENTSTQAAATAEIADELPGAPKQQTPKAGSTWAFWSSDSPKSKGASKETGYGEIAVIGDRSEAHPKPMDEGNMSSTTTKAPKAETGAKEIAASGKSTWRKTKRVRPPSMDIEAGSPSSARSAVLSAGSQPGSGTQTPTQTEMPPPKIDESTKSTAEAQTAMKHPPNLLLPSFSSTYQMKDNPSILKQVAQFLLRTQQPSANHVCRLKEPPKIRKALAIGVHGLFPHTYLRPMIGHPTGTSLRFATLGADAIRKWADAHGCAECEIEKVALEGEGKISDRVDNLWKLMLNWIDHIRKADLIIIACHSQGVPVSIMLIEKLIDLGIITDAKIGVCAMAGVALGPFPSHRSNFFTGSASELWEFGDPGSANSQRFEIATKRVLEYGARITFIGSIDDQVVPMESAVYSPAHHPYIFRAVFIDGRIHTPDFIAHLVGFALKLRNLGISDHGLIRELSIPLAGPLVSGEGHSRLYFEPAVYELAVTHALETTSTAKPVPVDVQPRGALGGANPYVLPWIMRGVLEEDLVKTELSAETDELLKQFDDWKPTNKALKEVKYRLEAVRSRL